MRLVVLESPYAGDAQTEEERVRVIARNKAYLQRCIRDCLSRSESPIASHQMLTDALRDADPAERTQGIAAGFAWRAVAAATVVYTDHGISSGMLFGIKHAEDLVIRQQKAAPPWHQIEFRTIGAEPPL